MPPHIEKSAGKSTYRPPTLMTDMIEMIASSLVRYGTPDKIAAAAKEFEKVLQETVREMSDPPHTITIERQCERCGSIGKEFNHLWAAEGVDLCTCCIRPDEEQIFDDIRFLENLMGEIHERLEEKIDEAREQIHHPKS